MGEVTGGEEPLTAGQVWRDLYATRWALLTGLLFALSCWGTWDSFRDVDGERWWAVVPLAAPAALTIAYLLPALWRPGSSAQALAARFLVTGMAAVVPLVVLNTLFLLVAYAVPANRVAILGNHYWWDGTLVLQVVTTSLGGWLGGMLGALFVFIVVILPVLALRRPRLIAEGSHLERIASGRRRMTAGAFVFVGLAVVVVGLIVMAVTEGLGGVGDLVRRVGLMIESGIHLEWAVWVLGWLLFAGGLLMMAYPIAQVLLIRTGVMGGGAADEPVIDDPGSVDPGAGAAAPGRRRGRGWPVWPLATGPAAFIAGLVLMAATGSPGGVGDFVIVVRHLGSPGFGAGAVVWALGWLLAAGGAIVLAYGVVRVVAALIRRRLIRR